MHFQKRRQVSEPFSLFLGCSGCFPSWFWSYCSVLYIRTGQSKLITASHSDGTILKTGWKIGKNWGKMAVSASRACLLTVGLDSTGISRRGDFHEFQSGPLMSKSVFGIPGKQCVFKVMNGSASMFHLFGKIESRLFTSITLLSRTIFQLFLRGPQRNQLAKLSMNWTEHGLWPWCLFDNLTIAPDIISVFDLVFFIMKCLLQIKLNSSFVNFVYSCEHPCDGTTWGVDCKNQCLCKNGADCDPVTGACTCIRGFQGDQCESKCDVGTYGDGCTEKCYCSSGHSDGCSHTDGTCICKQGNLDSSICFHRFN